MSILKVRPDASSPWIDIPAIQGSVGPIGPAGKDGADGKDGKDGKDGYTPVKGVDYFDGKDGQDGMPGTNGVDGKTPERGVDYWTAADKAEIVNEVLTSLPIYNGEVVDG